jgi:hypothetical protein
VNLQRLAERGVRRAVRTAGRDITIKRPSTTVDDGEGGVIYAGTGARTLEPQKLILLQVSNEFQEDDQGERVRDQYVLIGPPDADVKKEDWWVEEGLKFRVDFVDPDRSYQTQGRVLVTGA